MKQTLFFAALLVALYGLHRLALWMEEKGWIYYCKKKASANALGNAMLELQQIVGPGARHVLEVRRKQQVTRESHGDPPPGSPD